VLFAQLEGAVFVDVQSLDLVGNLAVMFAEKLGLRWV
jgi:hypothetical protein